MNLTKFCEDADALEHYQRASCPFFNKIRCPKSYRSTKSGDVKPCTQHRPVIRQSTKHYGQNKKHNIFDSMFRSGNMTVNPVVELSEVQLAQLNNASAPDASGAGVSPADASAVRRRKRHATVTSESASSPSPSASVGGLADSKVSRGHPPKSHHSNPKRGSKTRQAKSKYGAKSEKEHRLRSSKTSSRIGNSSLLKSKSKPNSLNIKLPLSFENASAYGWVTWQPDNSSTEVSPIALQSSKNESKSTEDIIRSKITSGPEFRAHNTTGSSKPNLRMGTTIVHDKGMYEPVNRKRRDVETTEKNPQKKEEIKVVVQDVKPSNDSRRYFQSRRFR